MTCRVPLLLTLLTGVAISGCDDRTQGRAAAAAERASAAPTPTASATPKASIMRPSVVDEATPAPPPPPPQPVKTIVYFGEGATDLSAETKAKLDQAVERIGAIDGPVTIRGHTDSEGNDRDNERVSRQRAKAVRDFLADRGVALERMRVIGLGEDRPAAPNATLSGEDDEVGRQRNRRVEIVAEPQLSAAVSDPFPGGS